MLRQLAASLVALGVAFAACTRVEVADPTPPPPLEVGGGAGQPAGGAGSVQAGNGAGGDDDPSSSGGDPGSLELGLWPTFTLDPERSRDVQAVSASVAALSAGSARLPLYERWDALSGASGTPLSATWERVDSMVQPYRERRGDLTLCIGIVDRAEPAWPFAGELDTDLARTAMEQTVDEAFTRYGGVLSRLCFGYELDRYLATANAGKRQRLLDFLKRTVEYASTHPLRSTRTSIAVALSLSALASDSDAPVAELSVGDELLGVYDPLDEGVALKEPAAVRDELLTALQTVARLPGPRVPFGLLEAGYPSARDAKSSESAQLAYFEALLGLLDERRDQLSFVGLYGLGDRAASECDAEAAVFGGTAEEAELRSRARCSMGLRAEGGGGGQAGADKPAWQPVLAAIARYR